MWSLSACYFTQSFYRFQITLNIKNKIALFNSMSWHLEHNLELHLFEGLLPVHLLHWYMASSVFFQNLNQNPRTLLPKFYGLYCVQSGGKNIRLAVMNNVLPRVVKMHLKYDLKGSTYKRRASRKEREKSKPTFKDLDFMQDFPDGLLLDSDMNCALIKTLQRDCLVRRE